MHCICAVLLVCLGVLSPLCDARGAGRAFPIHSENYAIDNFQRINPSIKWDPTNYLVDKSGEFANCDQINRGYRRLYDVTTEGDSMGVVFDHMTGDGVDAEKVNGYIGAIIDNWMRSHLYDATIREAGRFGCSVRPGCRGVVAVACLFSPASYEETPGNPPEEYKQQGQAFTGEQYDVAESITGNRWDRSHFLENLSGYEISCDMVQDKRWSYIDAIELAKEYGMEVMGLNGEAPNRGSTQDAMEIVLRRFKQIQSASSVGCSVIPDCRTWRGDLGDEMWVVITCLYEETRK